MIKAKRLDSGYIHLRDESCFQRWAQLPQWEEEDELSDKYIFEPSYNGTKMKNIYREWVRRGKPDIFEYEE